MYKNESNISQIVFSFKTLLFSPIFNSKNKLPEVNQLDVLHNFSSLRIITIHYQLSSNGLSNSQFNLSPKLPKEDKGFEIF